MGGSCSCLSSKGQTSTQAIEEQIEHSKTHWSEVSKFELDTDKVVEVSNMEVFQTLQSHPDWSTFFQTFGKDGVGELVIGEKFAKGGQVELYDSQIHWKKSWRNKQDLQQGIEWVLKVFKKETSLRQLQQQWPHGMLQNYVNKVDRGRLGFFPKVKYSSEVYLGILLDDGRFAFLMVKEHKDLRHRIDCLMLTTRENNCPFPEIEVMERLMFEVAMGMKWLHSRGIIHRDLKASNVLCTEFEDCCEWYMADFECSIGVIGTGFFRAPEILEACKDYSISDKPELFSKESDVYSYRMVCYEILTRKLLFEDYRQNDFDHVLVGERPEVPKYVAGWMRELLRMYWQSNPSERPSFKEILEVLLDNSFECRNLYS